MPTRGEIYFADLDPVLGSEQGGLRPVLIVQNDTGNKYSPTVIVAAITSSLKKRNMPTHILLDDIEGLTGKSYVLLEQLRTLDKRRLKNKVAQLAEDQLAQIDAALLVSIGVACTCDCDCTK